MKRFTSGHAEFQDFDWTEQAELRRASDVGVYDSYEDDGFVAHSAPLVMGGGILNAKKYLLLCSLGLDPGCSPSSTGPGFAPASTCTSASVSATSRLTVQ